MERYSNIEFILNLPAEDGIALLKRAIEEKRDELLFQRWIPYQGQMGFDEFKSLVGKSTKIEFKEKSTEEILKNVKGILDSFHKD